MYDWTMEEECAQCDGDAHIILCKKCYNEYKKQGKEYRKKIRELKECYSLSISIRNDQKDKIKELQEKVKEYERA